VSGTWLSHLPTYQPTGKGKRIMADWTDTMLDDLRTLWRHVEPNGKTIPISEIGRRMGLTKNAIVGKAHRIDLPSRGNPVNLDPDRPRATRNPAPLAADADTLPPLASMAPPEIIPEPSAPLPERLLLHMPMIVDGVKIAPIKKAPAPKPAKPRAMPALLARPFGRVICCLWPIGEPGTSSFHFCDDPSAAGRVYCESHCDIAYIKVQPRRLSSIEHRGPWRSPLTNLVTDFF
jgi:GcrA cell cycle regulator